MKSRPITSGKGRPTLRGIAQVAGVSVSTVSIVLAGKSEERRISPEVERRVREVAQQQDYSPNLLMHSLQQGRTQILSLYNGFGYRDREDLYLDRLSTAIERAAGRRKYDVLVHCDYTSSAEHSYRRLNGGVSDGLIYFGPNQQDPLLSLLQTSRLATVILNHRDRSGRLSSASDDVGGGMRAVADRLVALGHRRVAALSAGWRHPQGIPPDDSGERLKALRDRLAKHGVPLPDERVLPAGGGVDDLAPLLQHLLRVPDAPTALFCWHDRLGYTVLEACERLGIDVPRQLSLIGYDGLHWPSRSRHVLASVAVDMDAVAEAAVALLDDLITGKSVTPQEKILPVSLLDGTTLAPAAEAPA